MNEAISIVGALALGVLVPACARWLWKRLEGLISSFRDSITSEVRELKKEMFAISDRVSILEADSIAHGRKIAFFEGVHSERAATAKAVLDAAELRHSSPVSDPTHVVIDQVNLGDLKETQ